MRRQSLSLPNIFRFYGAGDKASDHGRLVICGWLLRGCRDDAAFDQGIAEPVCVIALVTEHRLGPRQGIKHQSRAFVIAHLASLSSMISGRPWSSHTACIRVQAAFCAPDTSEQPLFGSCKSRRLASIPAAVESPAPNCRKRLITTAYRYLERFA